MRNPIITSDNHTHGKTPVVSLCVEKDRRLFAKVKATRGAAWSQSRGFCSDAKDIINIAFANHHLEKGMDLMLIQESLGHKSSKTTEIYTRVIRKNIKKMRNLLDDLEI